MFFLSDCTNVTEIRLPLLTLIQLGHSISIIFRNSGVLAAPISPFFSFFQLKCPWVHFTSYSVSPCSWVHFQLLTSVATLIRSQRKSPNVSSKHWIIIHCRSFLWQDAHNPPGTSAKITRWKSIVFILSVFMKWRLQKQSNIYLMLASCWRIWSVESWLLAVDIEWAVNRMRCNILCEDCTGWYNLYIRWGFQHSVLYRHKPQRNQTALKLKNRNNLTYITQITSVMYTYITFIGHISVY